MGTGIGIKNRPKFFAGSRKQLIDDAIEFFVGCNCSEDAQFILNCYSRLHQKGVIGHTDYKVIVKVAQMQAYDT